MSESEQLFDNWPERYNRWFTTPIGSRVLKYERELVMELLSPEAGEQILDAGCGTGIFTGPILESGAAVTGLDLSLPMVAHAGKTLPSSSFSPLAADMLELPFADGQFDKTISITALEFIEDGGRAMAELFRVTRPGGLVVVATLNRLSPWAERRSAETATKEDSVFQQCWFRSGDDLNRLTPGEGVIRTAVHFSKDSDPETTDQLEAEGHRAQSERGAFVIGCWQKGKLQVS